MFMICYKYVAKFSYLFLHGRVNCIFGGLLNYGHCFSTNDIADILIRLTNHHWLVQIFRSVPPFLFVTKP